MLCLVLNPIIIIIKKNGLIWLVYSLYRLPPPPPATRTIIFGSSERGRWCVIVSHIRIASLSVKLLNFLLRHYAKEILPLVRSSRCNETVLLTITKNIRYYFSCAFINWRIKKGSKTSHQQNQAHSLFTIHLKKGRTPPSSLRIFIWQGWCLLHLW